MILVKINGEKVIGVYHGIDPSYQPQENEVMIEALPEVSIEEGQRAYLYWRNGQIEYDIKEI